MSREIGKSSAAFPFWEGTRAGRWSTVQVQRYEHSGLARITPRVKGHRKSREACAAVPAAEETQLSFSKRTQGLSPRYLQSLALRLKSRTLIRIGREGEFFSSLVKRCTFKTETPLRGWGV